MSNLSLPVGNQFGFIAPSGDIANPWQFRRRGGAIDEHATMLKNCPAMLPLRAAGDLCPSQHDVTRAAPRKAEKRFLLSGQHSANQRCILDPLRRKRSNQRIVHHAVELHRPTRHRMIQRHDKAVRNLPIMHNCPAAARPPNERTTATGGMHLAGLNGLKIAKRKRRRRPAIEPQHQRAIPPRRFAKRLIHRHVPSAVSGRVANQSTARLKRHALIPILRASNRGNPRELRRLATDRHR
jgi:hypothetical protein